MIQPDSPDHVVYRFSCNKDACQRSPSYIGYTTLTVKERMTQHAQKGSIHEHNVEEHRGLCPAAELLENTERLFYSSEKHELLLAEALLIKYYSPSLNRQQEGDTRILKIF